jgi:putative lipoprotein
MGSARHEVLSPVLAASLWWTCAQALAGTLEGTAAYRERIALPPDAVFEAVLEDVSRADAAAEVLGRARIDPAGQPPFRFQIVYQDAMVRPGHRYAVRATVRHRGRLLFASDRGYPVLAGGNAPLEIMLVRASERR